MSSGPIGGFTPTVISLIGEPQPLTPVYNPIVYKFSSTSYNQSGYRYIFDVYNGSSKIANFKVMPSIDGTGYIDISKVLSNFVDVDFNPLSYTTANATNSYINYTIKIGEEWAVNWQFQGISIRSSGSLSGYTQIDGSIASTYIVGDQVDITTNLPAGSPLLFVEGLHTIKEVLSGSMSYVIDILNTGGTASVAGIVSYADSRKTAFKDLTTSSGMAFNGVRSWKELPNWDYKKYLDISVTQPLTNLLTSLKPVVDNTGVWGPRFSNIYKWVQSYSSAPTSTHFSLTLSFANIYALVVNEYDATGTRRQTWLSDIIGRYYNFDKVTIYISDNANPANWGSFQVVQWSTPGGGSYTYYVQAMDISHFSQVNSHTYNISYSVEDNIELVDNVFYMTPDQDLWFNIATENPADQYTLVQATPETGTDEMDITGSGSVKQFKVSVNNNPTIPLSSMTVAPISSISFYVINYSTGLQVSDVYKIYIDNRCKIEDYEIAFMDRMGSILSYSFPLRSKETGSIIKEQYKKQVSYNETNTSYSNIYNSWDRGMTTNAVNVNKDLELNTNWMNDGMSLLFEELLTSPYTWIKIEGNYYACSINELSFEIQRQKNKRLIKKTISVKMSNENIINI